MLSRPLAEKLVESQELFLRTCRCNRLCPSTSGLRMRVGCVSRPSHACLWPFRRHDDAFLGHFLRYVLDVHVMEP